MSKVRLETVGIWSARILLVLMLFAPIGVYVYSFGFVLSDLHSRWGEMGSAMSGIYGPILTVLTLCVLVVQVRIQTESNKHMYDQAHLQLAHSDLTFYLCRLEAQLKESMPDGVSSNSFLQEAFKFASQDALRQPPLSAVAQEFNLQNPAILSTWHAILSIFAGLKAVNESSYELHFSTGRSKAIALLSYGTCIALDKYSWCLSRGGHDGPYCFASIEIGN